MRNRQSPQSGDKHPNLFPPVVRASLNPGPHCTTIHPKPNPNRLGFSFGKSPMLTRTYGNCLLTPCLPVLPIPTPVCLFFQQFLSLFSVCLLTFQEVEPSVHAGSGAMGCSCQLVGCRDRERETGCWRHEFVNCLLFEHFPPAHCWRWRAHLFSNLSTKLPPFFGDNVCGAMIKLRTD